MISEDKYSYEELKVALYNSIKLQSHYAKLLNMWDGGERMVFETSEQWLERLRELNLLSSS